MPWPRYVRLKTSASVSLSASTAAATSTTSILVRWDRSGPSARLLACRDDSTVILLLAIAPRDRGLEQEVVDLGVALGLPDVVAPDVRAVIGDDHGERARQTAGSASAVVSCSTSSPSRGVFRITGTRWTSRLATPRMPLSISRSRIATWSASVPATRSPARTADRAWEWTTLRAPRSRAARQKIWLHSLGRRSGSAGVRRPGHRPDPR